MKKLFQRLKKEENLLITTMTISGNITRIKIIHANFFHDFMNDSMFEDNRKRTEKLLEKLVKILDAELKARLKG